MQDELDLLDSSIEVAQKGKRPAFLTVLCILTFVGAGIGVFYCVIGWIGMSTAEKMMVAFQDNMGNGSVDKAIDGFRWVKLTFIAGGIGCILNIVGAVAMMFLRKWGFYLYVIGQAIPLFLIAYLILASSQDHFSLAGLIILSIFPVGFIVMYGLNYKFLK